MAKTVDRAPWRSLSKLREHVFPAAAAENEAVAAQYFEDYVADGRRGLRFVVGHPIRSAAALLALYRLPEVTAVLSSSPDGEGIRNGLSRSSVVGRTVVHSATAMVMVPADPADYSLGASKQTLRRKVRAARKAGVTWARMDDLDERRRLLALADERERTHPRELFRREPDNADMLTYQLWLAAYSADGRPLVLSVTAVDGEWSIMRYFCTLGDGPDHSNARYYLTQVQVEELAERGVRYLADAVSPAYLPNGLRSFQRMLGYRLVRVRLPKTPGSRSAESLPEVSPAA